MHSHRAVHQDIVFKVEFLWGPQEKELCLSRNGSSSGQQDCSHYIYDTNHHYRFRYLLIKCMFRSDDGATETTSSRERRMAKQCRIHPDVPVYDIQ